MSRSGYTDGLNKWSMIRWRGQVASAIRGKRGQALLKDLRDALLAMPEKRLIADELIDVDGGVCALGAVGKMRGLDMSKFDIEDPDPIAKALNIPSQLAQEIMFENDDRATPENRYTMMLRWVESRIKE